MRFGKYGLRLSVVACLAAVLIDLTPSASLAQIAPAPETARTERSERYQRLSEITRRSSMPGTGLVLGQVRLDCRPSLVR